MTIQPIGLVTILLDGKPVGSIDSVELTVNRDAKPIFIPRPIDIPIVWEWSEVTLYCIGGTLDGSTRKAMCLGFMHVSWTVEVFEFYERRTFSENGHTVAFWVLGSMTQAEFARRAHELFIDAAVLQDEQLI